jgi:hypothetical protein
VNEGGILIKRKKIAQFINEKLEETRHNSNTNITSPKTSNTLAPRRTNQLTQPATTHLKHMNKGLKHGQP